MASSQIRKIVFLANDIKSADKKRAVLLTVIGPIISKTTESFVPYKVGRHGTQGLSGCHDEAC